MLGLVLGSLLASVALVVGAFGMLRSSGERRREAERRAEQDAALAEVRRRMAEAQAAAPGGRDELVRELRRNGQL